MRLYVLCAVTLLGLPVASYAQSAGLQPGYIVRTTAAADTVHGYVDGLHATRLLGQIRFQASPDAPVEVLTPSQLLAAGTTDQRQAFRTRPVEGEARFLEIVASGHLTLYTGYYSQAKVEFLVEQAGGTLLPLPRAQYATLLPAVAGACSDAKRALPTYSRAGLGRFVAETNRCHPEPSRYYPGAKAEPVRVGLRAGVQSSQFWYVYNNYPFGYQKPASTTGVVGGLQAVLPVAGGFKAVVEATYSQASSTLQIRDRPGAAANYYTRRVTLQADMLQVPLLLRWQFGRRERRLRPYLEGGSGLNFLLQSRSSYEAVPEQSYDTPESYEIGINKTNLFVLGGAGVSYRTPLGVFALAARTHRMFLGSPRDRSAYRLNQRDVSLIYFLR